MRLKIVIFAVLLLTSTAQAELRLPKIFSSQMVLQQEMPIRVWGHAAAGEAVTVFFNGKEAAAKADDAGRWRVDLPAMKADGKAHTLTVKGANTIELKDVVLGEVWLAVGQSNMSRGLRYVKDRVKKEPMDFRDLRLFFVGLDQVPQREEAALTRGWAPATHDSMNNIFVHPTLGTYEFSEVTYYFGKAIHEKLKVPVGVISAAFPGSMASQWMPAEKPEERFDFSSGKPDKGPGSMYQAMMVGLPPFSMRGVIYYQASKRAGPIVLVGDLNVAPGEFDVWSHKQLLNVVSHTPAETDRLNAVRDEGGFVDLARLHRPDPEKLYTWWSYRSPDYTKNNRGRRLDHIWTSADLADRSSAEDFHIHALCRSWERPSDHVPVVAALKL